VFKSAGQATQRERLTQLRQDLREIYDDLVFRWMREQMERDADTIKNIDRT
jgi:hypothetical protein